MSIARFFAFFAVAAMAIPCGAQTQDPCTKAYVEHQWNDVVDLCGADTESAGHEVTTTSLTNEQKAEIFVPLITKTVYLAQAYTELGETSLAQLNMKKAGLWLEIARESGLDAKSAKALQGAIDGAASTPEPSPTPYFK